MHQPGTQARCVQAVREGRAPRPTRPLPPTPETVHPLLKLQGTIGNWAVLRLMQSGMLQAKLTVSHSDDIYEHEADRTADIVMAMSPPSFERQAGQEEEEGKLQPKALASQVSPPVQRLAPNEEEEQPLQTNRDSGDRGGKTFGDVETGLNRAKGAGQPLSQNERAFFEPRFGQDFDNVRIHDDAEAAALNRAVGAQAFTHGRDVYFNEGRYKPASSEGKRLMAHELTHVVQQTGNVRACIRRKIEVNPGLKLNTHGYTVSKTGNVYTCPAIVKNSVWNEIFTSLLFSPRVFKLKGNTNGEIDANFTKHIGSRYDIVEFASRKRYTFGAGASFKMNPKYWIVDSSGWRLKPGVDRREAIKDLNVHPEEYRIACLAATMLTMEGGGRSPLTDDYGAPESDWIPGDWGYITNTNFPTDGTGTPGTEGENIIYTGKDKFWGHFGPGNTYQTLKEWFDQVKSWNSGANIEDFRTRPTIGLE